MRLLLPLLALLAALLLPMRGASAADSKRIALVVGIGAYQHAPHLPNPVNDARAMAEALRALGFEVDEHVDVDYRTLAMALRGFGVKAQKADAAVVFFAGHGMQVERENFLLPADANLERERDLIYEALSLDLFLGEVSQAKKVGIVILDACRNNPFVDKLAKSVTRSASARGLQVRSGLARVDNTPSDTLVALATRADGVAEDGEGVHSPYTEALLSHLEAPGLELGLFFRKVRDTVMKATGGRQEPYTFGSLGAEPFYFHPQAPNRPPVVGSVPPLRVLSTAAPTPMKIPVPTDPDGDPMTVHVTALPQGGTVRVGARRLELGDTITPEQLAAAAFAPDGAFSGDAGLFTVTVDDTRGGVTVASVAVRVAPGNRPPVVEAPRAATMVLNRLAVAVPVDPDGDALTITVTAVPQKGVVRNGGKVVKAGDKVEAKDMPRLSWDADGAGPGEAGTFAYTVDDGRGGKAGGTVQIVVAEDGRPVAELHAPAAPAVAKDEAAPAQEVAPKQEVAQVAPPPKPPVAPKPPEAVTAPVAPKPPEAPPARANAPQLAPAPRQAAVAVPPAGKAATPGKTDIKDCAECPVLVPIPAGSFVMGSEKDTSAKPPHRVTLARGFALGKYEVTIKEWKACVAAGACTMPEMEDGVDERGPARNLDWDDAQVYVDWLSQTTGKPYRLPSEAEWEYAARAGTTSDYWWGEAVGVGHANCEDCGGPYDRKAPAPVGSFAANAFGLFDMNGGVAEWVADCWFPSHRGAPADGAVRDLKTCSKRVLKGGSWRNDHSYAAAWNRLSYDSDVRYVANGLRVARDLGP